jgi:copper(I)-binding protein
VTLSDTWVKAANSGMTAAFGTVSNTSSDSIMITAASSPAAGTVELHEVVDADGSIIMRPVEGGIFVPAQGTQVLEPGGYHLMLMDLPAPIEPGEDVAFTLTCSTGGTADYTAQAKTFRGADEKYTRYDLGLPATPLPATS